MENMVLRNIPDKSCAVSYLFFMSSPGVYRSCLVLELQGFMHLSKKDRPDTKVVKKVFFLQSQDFEVAVTPAIGA